MSARRTPRWTRAELAVLREHYPAGGMKAVVTRLPDRSWYAIYVMAAKLRLSAPKPDAPRCALHGERLEEAIRLREIEGWSFGKIGAHLGVAEASTCNAVLNAMCVSKGFTPAERGPNGRMTARGLERLRWMLKKGLKGVDIQLRLGLSASRIAEERRRYNAELRANGKALLPPPGGGVAYSGVRISPEAKREAERLFLEGYGTLKVSEKSGVSNTVATRIRNKLIAKLRRKGETLAGCDADGKRRVMRDHARHIADEQREKLRALILDRVPVRRAAGIVGIGTCSAYRIRDAMIAEGVVVPEALRVGRVTGLRAEMLKAQQIAPEHMMRFRQLVWAHGDADARRLLRAEIAEAKRNLTFEQKLELVARGQAKVVAVQRIVTAGPDRTLGGVTGAII